MLDDLDFDKKVVGEPETHTVDCGFFFHSCLMQFKHGMVITYFKKIMHNILYVTSVYLRAIISFFLVLHLNVSRFECNGSFCLPVLLTGVK